VDDRRAGAVCDVICVIFYRIEFFDCRDDAGDGIVDVGEVEAFFFAEDGERFVFTRPAEEKWDDAITVVVHSVDVAETEDDVVEFITAGVRLDERLAGDFAGGVGALAVLDTSILFRYGCGT